MLIARIGRKETVLEPHFRLEDLIEIGLETEEYLLLKMVNGKRTLYELCSKGPKSAPENAKILYAFKVLRLIGRHGSEGRKAGRVKVRLRATSDGLPDS